LNAATQDVRTAYADFQKVNKEVLELSRRNSNIRSFALSLGEKRLVTAKCRELLTALQNSIESHRFEATR
jgi:hypothetical protein